MLRKGSQFHSQCILNLIKINIFLGFSYIYDQKPCPGVSLEIDPVIQFRVRGPHEGIFLL